MYFENDFAVLRGLIRLICRVRPLLLTDKVVIDLCTKVVTILKQISVQRLMLDSVVADLNRKDRMRELAKPDDIVWQHMKLEHFRIFLEKGFHFVRYDKLCENNKGQEREWSRYYPYLKDYSQNIYISCWYNQKQLSKMIFEQYARGDIAIGVKIEDLESSLINSDNIYSGNVQYISNEELEIYNNDVFADYQKIGPVYLKYANCDADKEFRVCLYEKDKSNEAFVKVKCKFGRNWYIAVTREDNPDLDEMLKQNNWKRIKCDDFRMDGFIVYEVAIWNK